MTVTLRSAPRRGRLNVGRLRRSRHSRFQRNLLTCFGCGRSPGQDSSVPSVTSAVKILRTFQVSPCLRRTVLEFIVVFRSAKAMQLSQSERRQWDIHFWHGPKALQPEIFTIPDLLCRRMPGLESLPEPLSSASLRTSKLADQSRHTLNDK